MKISIEGAIGSGKSTLLSRLCSEKRIPVFLEPIDEWGEWLTMFYKDPERWGMSFNLKVLMSFHKWKGNSFFSLYERSPISNRYVFAQLQYEQNRMTKLELDMFSEIYKELSWKPDVVIYIRTDPSVSMERIMKRARGCESDISMDYIEDIHQKHEELFGGGYSVATLGVERVIVIDGNQNADDVYADVVAKLANLQTHI
jgi:deoxyadenosine/deoxycytidine kinase